MAETKRTRARHLRAVDKPTPWLVQSLLVAGFTRNDGRMLGVVVDPTSCGVMAFEGISPRWGETPDESLAAFFGDHAHAVVTDGKGLTLAKAVELAEDYGRRWKASELEAPAKCDCGEIGERK